MKYNFKNIKFLFFALKRTDYGKKYKKRDKILFFHVNLSFCFNKILKKYNNNLTKNLINSFDFNNIVF